MTIDVFSHVARTMCDPDGRDAGTLDVPGRLAEGHSHRLRLGHSLFGGDPHEGLVQLGLKVHRGLLHATYGTTCFDLKDGLGAAVDEVASGSHLAFMRAVGLKILKNHLSEYVRLAASGEVILVTDRERVVAELVPPAAGRAVTPADAALAEVVRKGWLTPALGASGDVVPSRPVASLATVLEELDRDRDEG